MGSSRPTARGRLRSGGCSALCIKRGGGRVSYRYANGRRAAFVQFAWPVFGAIICARGFFPLRGGGIIMVPAARNVKNGILRFFR